MLSVLDALLFKEQHWGMQSGVCLPACPHACRHATTCSIFTLQRYFWLWNKLGQMLSITELAPLLHANPTGRLLQLVMKDNPHLRGATFTSLSVSSQMTACLVRASRTSTTAWQLWSFVFSSRRTSWRWWKLPSPMSFAVSTRLKSQLLLQARNNMEAKVNSQHRHWESCICL